MFFRVALEQLLLSFGPISSERIVIVFWHIVAHCVTSDEHATDCITLHAALMLALVLPYTH